MPPPRPVDEIDKMVVHDFATRASTRKREKQNEREGSRIYQVSHKKLPKTEIPPYSVNVMKAYRFISHMDALGSNG
jgi:hypothetical protein